MGGVDGFVVAVMFRVLSLGNNWCLQSVVGWAEIPVLLSMTTAL